MIAARSASLARRLDAARRAVGGQRRRTACRTQAGGRAGAAAPATNTCGTCRQRTAATARARARRPRRRSRRRGVQSATAGARRSLRGPGGQRHGHARRPSARRSTRPPSRRCCRARRRRGRRARRRCAGTDGRTGWPAASSSRVGRPARRLDERDARRARPRRRSIRGTGGPACQRLTRSCRPRRDAVDDACRTIARRAWPAGRWRMNWWCTQLRREHADDGHVVGVRELAAARPARGTWRSAGATAAGSKHAGLGRRPRAGDLGDPLAAPRRLANDSASGARYGCFGRARIGRGHQVRAPPASARASRRARGACTPAAATPRARPPAGRGTGSGPRPSAPSASDRPATTAGSRTAACGPRGTGPAPAASSARSSAGSVAEQLGARVAVRRRRSRRSAENSRFSARGAAPARLVAEARLAPARSRPRPKNCRAIACCATGERSRYG